MLPPGVDSSGDGANSASASAYASPQVREPSAAGGGGAGADLGSSGFSEEDGGRSSGGNRWPRQETLYLLKIRSDMDVAFRDSSLKGPLWDEVSRKLASLGFNRSAKKCKEKFENVYKYHKRIKDGRSSKSDGKTYKFFEQLQALEATPSAGNHNQPPLALPPPPAVSPMPIVSPVPHQNNNNNNNNVDPISVAAPAVAMPAVNINHAGRFPFSQLNMSASNSSSSSTSSDEEPRRNRKRKWKEFFGKLMTEVINKQEELQSKFLDTLERRERDRAAREEAWRIQEMAKMKREHELLVQERSMVAAKDVAVITFLQKITEQNPKTLIPQIPAMQLLQQQQQNHQPPPQPSPSVQPPPQPPLAGPAVPVSVPVSVPAPASAPPLALVKSINNGNGGSGGTESMLQPSPSRWPKAEINVLIQLRTTLDTKYQENGPKGPLWEEVSSAMRNLGYNRNAKRCKEKWENINKYYKKVKESSKKRPEDSKTCPYFHQLDAIYREKANSVGGGTNSNNSNNNPGLNVKPEAQMAPIMARPEQQWPLLAAVQEHHQNQYQQQQQQQQSKLNEHRGIEDNRNADLNEDDYDDDEEEDDEEEDEDGGDYEIAPNKTASMAAAE